MSGIDLLAKTVAEFLSAMNGNGSRYAFGTHMDRLRAAYNAYVEGGDAPDIVAQSFADYDVKLDKEWAGGRHE